MMKGLLLIVFLGLLAGCGDDTGACYCSSCGGAVCYNTTEEDCQALEGVFEEGAECPA